MNKKRLSPYDRPQAEGHDVGATQLSAGERTKECGSPELSWLVRREGAEFVSATLVLAHLLWLGAIDSPDLIDRIGRPLF
jgi:hypothetical protein